MVNRHFDMRKMFRQLNLAEQTTDTKQIKLLAGETLFYSGEIADALYLVESGSLGVYGQTANGDTVLTAVVNSGETIGEMAIISGERRSATVIAIRDCLLLRLTKGNFRRLVRQQPKLAHEINRILSHRLMQMARPGNQPRTMSTIAFLPASKNLDLNDIVGPLHQHMLATGSKVAMIKSSDNFDPASLNDLELNHDRVVFVGAEQSPERNRLFARQSDRIVMVANAKADPTSFKTDTQLQHRINQQLVDLLLVHDGTDIPLGLASKWRQAIACKRLFHLTTSATSSQRIARIFTGRAISLVLSGGGARAYAHIGVMKALTEHNIPIDFIGGTSMGAIIGACYARGWTMEQLINNIRQTFVNSNPLSDYTLPIISLVRGAKVNRLLKRYFTSLDIDDLLIPFYCASSNLTTSTTHIHNHGLLWRALRSSIALPGILPPVMDDEGLLCDGGVIENLPVEIMRTMHPGLVIASDVARDMALDCQWLKDQKKRNIFSRMLNPPIIQILMRAGTIGSEISNRQQASAADIHISPVLEQVEIRDWRAFEQTIEIGYRAANEHLAQNKTRITNLVGG